MRATVAAPPKGLSCTVGDSNNTPVPYTARRRGVDHERLIRGPLSPCNCHAREVSRKPQRSTTGVHPVTHQVFRHMGKPVPAAYQPMKQVVVAGQRESRIVQARAQQDVSASANRRVGDWVLEE